MLSRLSAFEYAINQRNMREKSLFLLTGLAAIVFIWEMTLHAPLVKSVKKYKKEAVSTKKQISDTKIQVETVLEKIRSDPSKALNEQRDALTAEVRTLDVKLNQLMGSLVRPNEMIGLLKSFVDEDKTVTIVSMRNLEPTALQVAKSSTSRDKEEKKPVVKVMLYKHGVDLLLTGNFFDTLDYLEKLEHIDKKIIWDLVEYKVDKYPLASIHLTVKTISDQRSWIGV